MSNDDYGSGEFEISPDALIQDRETFQEGDPDFEIDPEDLQRLELARLQQNCPYSHELDSCLKCGWRRSGSEFTPTTAQVCYGYSSDPEAEYHDPIGYPGYQLSMQKAFYRWLDKELREAKAKGWDEARESVRGIPYWFDPTRNYGEFDLQPLGPNHTSEQGAFMAVREALKDNPYRKED